MTRLTQKGVKFEWDDLCEKAFQELKRRFDATTFMVGKFKYFQTTRV